MFDGFWSGIFGGVVAPVLSKWLQKFRYTTIFLCGSALTCLSLFVAIGLAIGWGETFRTFFALKSGITVILVSFGIGCCSVFVVWINSPETWRLGGVKSSPKRGRTK